jgi:ParB family chromosome partitioning protein
VLQPILVRPVGAGAAKYRIIAGERRFRAATEAGLTEIPAYVRAMNDEDALSAGLMENLLREDIHPLDEADGFLRLKDELKLDLRAIAARVGKDARYVTRRLSLTCLIKEARDDFRRERITLGHALEISRLDPVIQPDALLACYEIKTVPSSGENGLDYVADKERPARPVRYLQEWLLKNVHLNLKQAPFKLDDARLRADGLTCLECPQRSGFNKLLFADIEEADTCLNPLCFQAKRQQFVQLTKTALEEKTGKPAVSISAYYGAGNAAEGTLALGAYQLLAKRDDRCEHAVQAVYADGGDLGKVKWVCHEPSCKDHLGRAREAYAPAANGAGPVGSSDDRHARKQELFDIKVAELVRKRVMKEAMQTFAWPLERKQLDEAAKEFFRRIPTDVQKTVCEVFGWQDELATRMRFSDETVLKELGKLDDNQLAQFLMLCSFAHYGANPYGGRAVDQGEVLKLGKACGVNHKLIDAEVRAELCPKKYQGAHLVYLEAVKAGKRAQKPVVYEQTTEAVPAVE